MTREPERLARRLGHSFADPGLLEAALTHRSAGRPNNERLEFLGDALLDLVIAEALYMREPRAAEGSLSRLRASLVRQSTLAGIAAELELAQYLRLGPGEVKSGGHRRASILADALEAVFGAIYLDAGFVTARQVILGLFERRLGELPAEAATLKDPKTELQERLQARGLGLPVYTLERVEGEAHEQRFHVACAVAELAVSERGAGSTRRGAEQAAAALVLAQVGDRE